MKIGQKGREEVRGTAQIKNSPKNFYQNCLIQFGAFAGMVYVFIRAVIAIAWAKYTQRAKSDTADQIYFNNKFIWF